MFEHDWCYHIGAVLSSKEFPCDTCKNCGCHQWRKVIWWNAISLRKPGPPLVDPLSSYSIVVRQQKFGKSFHCTSMCCTLVWLMSLCWLNKTKKCWHPPCSAKSFDIHSTILRGVYVNYLSSAQITWLLDMCLNNIMNNNSF
jgi:hypothetical protein